MRQLKHRPPLRRTILPHLIASGLLAILVVSLVALPWALKLSICAIGVALGFLLAYGTWRRQKARINERKRIFIFYEESVPFALVLLLDSAPGILALLLISTFGNPSVLSTLLSLIVFCSLGFNGNYYRLVRRYEQAHGDLAIRSFYAKSCAGLEGLLNKTGVVIRACQPTGKVRISNEIWNAESIDGSELPVQTKVLIRDVEGLKVFVKRA